MSNSTHNTFIETFNSITNLVAYDDSFNNGTGYFNALTEYNTGLMDGSRFTMTTPAPNNRKVIGVVTPVGNVVFFERYTNGENGVIVQNLPYVLSGLYMSGVIEEQTLFMATGGQCESNMNIGKVLARVVKYVAKTAEAAYGSMLISNPTRVEATFVEKGVSVRIVPDTE